MKPFIFRSLALISLGLLVSCSPVSVVTDYDTSASFGEYKSYAFFKTGIDKAQISDLDKRRILRAIDAEMTAKDVFSPFQVCTGEVTEYFTSGEFQQVFKPPVPDTFKKRTRYLSVIDKGQDHFFQCRPIEFLEMR